MENEARRKNGNGGHDIKDLVGVAQGRLTLLPGLLDLGVSDFRQLLPSTELQWVKDIILCFSSFKNT